MCHPCWSWQTHVGCQALSRYATTSFTGAQPFSWAMKTSFLKVLFVLFVVVLLVPSLPGPTYLLGTGTQGQTECETVWNRKKTLKLQVERDSWERPKRFCTDLPISGPSLSWRSRALPVFSAASTAILATEPKAINWFSKMLLVFESFCFPDLSTASSPPRYAIKKIRTLAWQMQGA